MKASKWGIVGLLALLLALWVAPVNEAAAQGTSPPQFWAARQNVVKAIGEWVWSPPSDWGAGTWQPRHFNDLRLELENKGWRLSHWSSVGGSNVIYYYFSRVVYMPLFALPLAPVQEFMYRHNPYLWSDTT